MQWEDEMLLFFVIIISLVFLLIIVLPIRDLLTELLEAFLEMLVPQT